MSAIEITPLTEAIVAARSACKFVELETRHTPGRSCIYSDLGKKETVTALFRELSAAGIYQQRRVSQARSIVYYTLDKWQVRRTDFWFLVEVGDVAVGAYRQTHPDGRPATIFDIAGGVFHARSEISGVHALEKVTRQLDRKRSRFELGCVA